MKIPETPSRESQRLAALREYDVLDTIPEQALDDLAALAAQICGAPIALVSLVDEGRQWFKARVGFEPPETTRDVSFCGHAILGTGVFIVPDATVDDRFADNPLVVGDPKVRFYAGAPLVTNDGHSIGALCVMDHVARDLTAAQGEALQMLSRQVVGQLELRRQARDLAESEARLHAVFANCPVAMTIHRMSDRTFVTVNSAFTQLLGWEEREVVGRTSDEVHFVSPDVAQQIRARLDAGGLRGDEVWQAWTKNGDKRHVLISSTVVDITRGPHAITTFVDVSRRSESELAANRLAAIVASSEDAIVGKALDGTVTSWNPGAERLFGLSAAEMVGNAIRRVIPADRQGEEDEIIARIASGEVIPHFETERLTRDGRVICVSVAASPIRDEHGTVCGGSTVTRDITERKRIEAAQRESDLRYRALFDYQPDGIVIADRESYYLDANASLCEMLGYSREEIVGLHASSIVAPEEVPYVGRALQQINSGVAYRREWQFVRKDRRTFPAEVRATLMPDGNLIGIVRDVTERNKSEARFRRLIDSNVQGVVFWRGDGEIFDANDAFLAIADLERSEIASGRVRWAMLTPPEYAGADARAMEDVRTRGAFAPYEKELLRRDGSRRHVLVGGASLGDGTSECVGFVVDSTDRKRLEDQFLRAQRMESIGTLAGGIAHDLNNALLPIMLSVEVLKEIVKDGEALEFLDTLEASARHGAELVQQVLSFARGVEGQRISVNPLYLMNELMKVMRDTFPKSLQVRVSGANNLWGVKGDPTQMRQVFLNLCVNARDAMPNGGKLSVTMENAVLDETYAAMNVDSRPGSYVRIAISDTGKGIAPAIRERIFDPFFTTKATGHGTGLGLSTVMGIVRSHGGFVHVYSEPGLNTTFSVYLPADTMPTEAPNVDATARTLPPGEGELVLLVDDEESIRSIARGTLERFGYRVITASNGAEGVAQYVANAADVAVVITDMAMPIMDGPAMVVALKAINPLVKIIGSSGQTSEGGVGKALDAGVLQFTPKPYTAETILNVLHDVLRGKSRG